MYFDRFPAEAGLTPEWLHPYRAARVVADGVTVGWFGQLHPREAAARKLKETGAGGRALSRPALQAAVAQAGCAGDFALSAGAARFFAGSGREHRAGKRSTGRWPDCGFPNWWTGACARCFAMRDWARASTALLLGATFQAPDRTLREEELQSFQARVVEAVGKAGARLRE